MISFVFSFINRKGRRIILILLAVICISLFILTPIFDNPRYYAPTLERLDSQKAELTAMSAVTSAAAVALAAVPDDSTTPIADQIAELAGYVFEISLVILIEKYIVVLSGHLAFRWLLPIGCGFLIAFHIFGNKRFRHIAVSLFALAACLFLMVPISLDIGDHIDHTFDLSRPVRIAMHEEDIEAASTEAESNEESDNEAEEKQPFFEKAGNFFSGLFNKAKALGTDAVNLLSSFVDAFVALIIKDCVIPIATCFIFFKLCKRILSGLFDKE